MEYLLPRARTLVEFGGNGYRDKNAKENGHPRVQLPHAKHKQDSATDRRHGQRNRKVALDALETSLAPRKQRTRTREEQEQKSDRCHHLVEERSTDGDGLIFNRLGQNRKYRSPQDGKDRCQQNPVIE